MKILFAVLFSFPILAQIGTGQWRLHVPNKKAFDVVELNNVIYTAFDQGLLEYDISSTEKSLWTKVNSLSDISISCLGVDKVNQAIYIGYENGNIDRIQNNTVTNMPSIKLAQLNGSKRINKIVYYNKFLYFATGFSIIKFDPIKFEVRDTYYPTNGIRPIKDVAFTNDSIFAVSSEKLFKSSIKNPSLADASQWKIDSRVPINSNSDCYYSDLEILNNQLYLVYNDPNYGSDSVYCVNNLGCKLLINKFENLEINSLQNINGKIGINIDSGIKIFESDNISNYFLLVSGVSVANSVYRNGIIWIADKYKGLVKFENNQVNHLEFEGPENFKSYAIDCNQGRLLVASGGLTLRNMTYNSSGIYNFYDEKWKTYNRNLTPTWKDKNIWDYLSISINPTNVDQFAVGTFSDIPLTIFEEDSQLASIFTLNNSSLQRTSYNPSAMIGFLKYDNSGNLWVSNNYSISPLKVYTKDKKWVSLALGNSMMNKSISKIAIDYNENKWLVVPTVGIVGLNDNKTPDNLSDDKIKIIDAGVSTGAIPSTGVTSVAVGFNNEVWIGTESGFAILNNSENVFDATYGNYNTTRIKLKFEGENEYLLGTTYITDIEVDGANRKWLGTANTGIFLLSEDGSEIIQNYTTDNSPLISNVIIDMSFDYKTGELFIATDKGLVSYRTDASEGAEDYSNVTIFPNPVKPDFSGPITLQGIKYDSDVNVTDVAGNLVYKTTSKGGTVTWDGKTLTGERVKGGVYLFWTAPNDVNEKGRKVGKVVIVN